MLVCSIWPMSSIAKRTINKAFFNSRNCQWLNEYCYLSFSSFFNISYEQFSICSYLMNFQLIFFSSYLFLYFEIEENISCNTKIDVCWKNSLSINECSKSSHRCIILRINILMYYKYLIKNNFSYFITKILFQWFKFVLDFENCISIKFNTRFFLRITSFHRID